MKTVIQHHAIPMYSGDAYDTYFGGMKACFFDIETTGLNDSSSKVILTALLIPDRTGVTITQYLAEDPFEEDLVICAAMEKMQDEAVDYLVTYNGDSFDIPFMKMRIEALGLPYDLCLFDFDLYRFVRKNTVFPENMTSLSQKSLENRLGLSAARNDVISGRESVTLYYEYIKSLNADFERIILTHNSEDVLQLLKLLTVIGEDDFSNYLNVQDLHAALAKTGFPAAGCALSVRPRINRGCFVISGRQLVPPADLINAVIFSDTGSDISAEFNKKTSSFSISVPLITGADSLAADLTGLDIDTDRAKELCLNEMDGYINDFLILVENRRTMSKEINILSLLVAEKAFAYAGELCGR